MPLPISEMAEAAARMGAGTSFHKWDTSEATLFITSPNPSAAESRIWKMGSNLVADWVSLSSTERNG